MHGLVAVMAICNLQICEYYTNTCSKHRAFALYLSNIRVQQYMNSGRSHHSVLCGYQHRTTGNKIGADILMTKTLIHVGLRRCILRALHFVQNRQACRQINTDFSHQLYIYYTNILHQYRMSAKSKPTQRQRAVSSQPPCRPSPHFRSANEITAESDPT